ncbi:hypothetical protein DACRYDRAFT_21692 [Dacryopinax primogenitus]|uniref:Transcription initiation factor TFIID subunit 2 n=1 Tax=Dacryopinax primogenitus (strain DJM 731) TaxID=1858805 RepID=M5G9W1_DACPD|nr:uncharacterized protein DACRYDRAFT_21692 [Dacryopinax primogenitus]EJU02667.1 hypothetical protein DACRYDRAFT_21692 [Dacryopinax primogenitus]
MQRESARRGFTLSHQRVVLDIDFSANVNGYTELTILPNDTELRTVSLHCRQCIIDKVIVNGTPADFVHQDPLANIAISNPTDVHLWTELKRKTYSALAEADEGELAISIPRDVAVRASSVLPPTTPETAHSETFEQRPNTEVDPSIIIRIDYHLRHPKEGLSFILPTKTHPYRVPHVYTSPTSADAARCWAPCVDNLWERCTWELEFIVPRSLTAEEDVSMTTGPDNMPVMVVCSGEFREQVAHPHSSKKSLWFYRQDTLTSVQHIAFAAGPFRLLQLRDEKPDDSSEGDESHPTRYPMHAFCLPGLEDHLKPTTSFLSSALSFFVTEYGAYPFSSYGIVFVDDLPRERSDNAGLTVASNNLLHGEDAIDQVFETRQQLSHALAVQWAGINIIQKTWSDTWLVNALALYMSGLFFKKTFGNNEFRFRIARDMARVCTMDNGAMPPICQPGAYEPPDPDYAPFINIKGPVVLHILDRHLGKSGTSLGLSRVLPKIFLSSMAGELTNNTLSTHSFLRTCRKVSGVDPKTFADQWIYGSGTPRFGVTASFNRKKMAVEVTIAQDCPAYMAHEGDPVGLAVFNPVQLFEGPITIRIHEADGTPYEHVLNINSQFKKYEVPFNTKYKRVRRHTKRYAARQAAAAAAAAGDQDAAEAMVTVDMSFGLALWEEEAQREAWRVSDWSEEEEHIMESSTYEWIRCDADFEWIATIRFEQPDFMWTSQLQRDRDVVAQLEAIHALARMPSLVVSSILTKTVLVENYFFRVRMEAALALQSCANIEHIGMFHLFKLFTRYCYSEANHGDRDFREKFIPEPNDFKDFASYFIRKSVLVAISRCRDDSNGNTWSVARRLFIDVLRYNNNAKNQYSDSRYLSTAIVALGGALVPGVPPERGILTDAEGPVPLTESDATILEEAVQEVERYRLRDQYVPSQHNVITIAALEFKLMLMLGGLIATDGNFFLEYTREENFVPVRLAAFDALLVMKWYMRPALIRYFFSVVINDPSRVIRRHLAHAMVESLGVLYQIGELGSGHKKEPILIEEDGTQKKKPKSSEAAVMARALRKELQKSATFRECILPTMQNLSIDQEVRWCMIQLAEFFYKPHEEALPKVTITLPPTPISETAPQLATPVLAPPVPALPKIKAIKIGISGIQKDRPLTPSGALPPLAPAVRHDISPTNGTAAVPIAPISIKPKKIKPLERAQERGMSSNDLKACRQALKRLNMNKHADLFRMPVDPIRDRAPNYFDVIKNPMDLSNISAKLEDGRYGDRFAFEQDFRLMIQNAHTYNPLGTYAHTEANKLQEFFDKQWARISKTLDAAQSKEEAVLLSAVAPPSTIPAEIASPVAPSATVAQPSAKKAKIVDMNGTATPTTVKIKPKVKPPATDQTPIAPAATPDTAPPPIAKLEAKVKLPKVKISVGPKRTTPKGPKKRDAADAALDELLGEEVDAMEAERPVKKPRKSAPSAPPPIEDELLASLEEEVAHAATSTAQPIEPRFSETPPVVPPPMEVPPPVPAPAPAAGPAIASSPSKRKTEPTPRTSDEPVNEKKCRAVMKIVKALPQAYIFLRPVDPIADGCPTYYDEIKNPMDFGTMENKLTEGRYDTMSAFAADFDLVIGNCRTFNPPGTDASIMADIVDKAFKKEWSKVLVKKLAYNEKRSLQTAINKLRQMPSAFVFLDPVDPVALGIPTYFDVIPKKDARDLSTIKTKLDQDKYDSIEALDADIRLMVDNAIKFNGAESEVAAAARQVDKDYNVLVKPFRTPATNGATKGKRKETDEKTVAPGGPAKKQKKAV